MFGYVSGSQKWPRSFQDYKKTSSIKKSSIKFWITLQAWVSHTMKKFGSKLT